MGIEVIILLFVAIFGWTLGISAGLKSILSPIGMFVVTTCCSLIIAPAFQAGDVHGWFMVGFTVFYLIITLRAIQLYNRLNKKSNDS